jgi:hypothetical protein
MRCYVTLLYPCDSLLQQKKGKEFMYRTGSSVALDRMSAVYAGNDRKVAEHAQQASTEPTESVGRLPDFHAQTTQRSGRNGRSSMSERSSRDRVNFTAFRPVSAPATTHEQGDPNKGQPVTRCTQGNISDSDVR